MAAPRNTPRTPTDETPNPEETTEIDMIQVARDANNNAVQAKADAAAAKRLQRTGLLLGGLALLLGIILFIWLATKSSGLSDTDVQAKVDAAKPDLSGLATKDELKKQSLTPLELNNTRAALNDLYDAEGRKKFLTQADLNSALQNPDGTPKFLAHADVYNDDGTLAEELDTAVRKVAQAEIKVECDKQKAERAAQAPKWRKALDAKIDAAVDARVKAMNVGGDNTINVELPDGPDVGQAPSMPKCIDRVQTFIDPATGKVVRRTDLPGCSP